MTANPFTDPAAIAALYNGPDRLRQRTGALHAAKIRGTNVAATIADLAAAAAPHETVNVVVDIGCGRGTTTRALAHRLSPRRLIAVDLSAGLLAATRQRVPLVEAVVGDLHHLPTGSDTANVVVAAFCLYHSQRPEHAVREIARCLTVGGCAVLVTKSLDSYQAIDHLVAASGIDPDAVTRPSLYDTFNTTSAARIASHALQVEQVRHEPHVFRFADFDHLATYISTSPKYQFPEPVSGNAAAIAAELRRRVLERPTTAASTVTYVVARKP